MEISDFLVAHAFDNTRHYYLHNKVMTDASNGSSVLTPKTQKERSFRLLVE